MALYGISQLPQYKILPFVVKSEARIATGR